MTSVVLTVQDQTTMGMEAWPDPFNFLVAVG